MMVRTVSKKSMSAMAALFFVASCLSSDSQAHMGSMVARIPAKTNDVLAALQVVPQWFQSLDWKQPRVYMTAVGIAFCTIVAIGAVLEYRKTQKAKNVLPPEKEIFERETDALLHEKDPDSSKPVEQSLAKPAKPSPATPAAGTASVPSIETQPLLKQAQHDHGAKGPETKEEALDSAIKAYVAQVGDATRTELVNAAANVLVGELKGGLAEDKLAAFKNTLGVTLSVAGRNSQSAPLTAESVEKTIRSQIDQCAKQHDAQTGCNKDEKKS